jgi:hypothetical protein
VVFPLTDLGPACLLSAALRLDVAAVTGQAELAAVLLDNRPRGTGSCSSRDRSSSTSPSSNGSGPWGGRSRPRAAACPRAPRWCSSSDRPPWTPAPGRSPSPGLRCCACSCARPARPSPSHPTCRPGGRRPPPHPGPRRRSRQHPGKRARARRRADRRHLWQRRTGRSPRIARRGGSGGSRTASSSGRGSCRPAGQPRPAVPRTGLLAGAVGPSPLTDPVDRVERRPAAPRSSGGSGTMSRCPR